MKRIIKVLQMDIDEARAEIRRNKQTYICSNCPIARAASRALNQPINCTYTHLLAGAMGRIAELPDEALRFIEEFDAGKPVEPFEFEIYVE